MKTIEFKPSVTVRVEANEGEIDVYVNDSAVDRYRQGERIESYLEIRYPGLTAAVEELRNPLAEDEAWIAGQRTRVSNIRGPLFEVGALIIDLDGIKLRAAQDTNPEGWPRALAIAERLLAEREPKIEARWERGAALLYENNEWWGPCRYAHESFGHSLLDRVRPGAWEKHVLPCILANRPLASNEYRDSCGMIWQFDARQDVLKGPQARIRYVTDRGNFGSWHSCDRRDLLADPVWAAAFDYADRMFPPPQHTTEKVQSLDTRIKEIANKHQCSTAAAVLLYLEEKSNETV